MGNNKSKITIEIEDDKYTYNTGDIVKGKVCVSVNIESGILAKCLYLRFKGREQTTIQGLTSQSIVVRSNMLVHKTKNGLISYGKHEFPFEFVVPDLIPSTMFPKSEPIDETRNFRTREIYYEMMALTSYIDMNSNKYDNRSDAQKVTSQVAGKDVYRSDVVPLEIKALNSTNFQSPIVATVVQSSIVEGGSNQRIVEGGSNQRIVEGGSNQQIVEGGSNQLTITDNSPLISLDPEGIVNVVACCCEGLSSVSC